MQAETNAKFEQIDARFERLDRRLEQFENRFEANMRAMDARFEQAHQTMTTNLQVVLAAIQGLKDQSEKK